MKYEEWSDIWLNYYVKPIVKIRTYEKYSQLIKLHVLPSFGEMEMEEMDSVMMQKYSVKLANNGNTKTGGMLSASVVNCTINVLQASIKTASAADVCRKKVEFEIRRPRIVEKKVECFPLKDQRKIERFIYDAGSNKLYGIIICLYTGLRVGELMALEWTDIDFGKRLMSVTKSCHYGKNKEGIYGRIVESPKTEESNRVIPVPKQLIAILKRMKSQSKSRYVIENEGKPIAVRSYQNTFSVLLEKLMIEHKGFHALRHTFATRALECGMDIKTLSEIMGHKNSTITLNRYVHSLLPHKREMMNKLGRNLDGLEDIRKEDFDE